MATYCYECGHTVSADGIRSGQCFHCGARHLTDVQWELCSIVLGDQRDDQTQDWEEPRFRARFVAEVVRDGLMQQRVASDSEIVFAPQAGPQQNAQTLAVLNSFVAKLTSQGWQSAGKEGPEWYALKYRRRVSR